jgi:hypothetical protein
MISGQGYIDIDDVGQPTEGPKALAIDLNGQRYWYDGQGHIEFLIGADGSFLALGQGNDVQGQLKSIPVVTEEVLALFKAMMEEKILPYQNPPTGTPKSVEEIAALGREKYPKDLNAFEFAMSLYDWTSADFIRVIGFNQMAYTGMPNLPVDVASFAASIWACDYPNCTAKDANFMNMFLMKPATSEADVRQQLARVEKVVQRYAMAETILLVNALLKLPKVSTLDYPLLYRGGMDISGNTLDNVAPSFCEFPGNNGPLSAPLIYPIEKALGDMLKPGSVVTTKGPWSFSNDLDGAKVWQRGILVTCKPPEGYDEWPGGADITEFSLNPDIFEVNFPPDTRFLIESYEWITFDDKPVCHFTMRMLGFYGANWLTL